MFSVGIDKLTCKAFSVANEAESRISPCISNPSPQILGPFMHRTAAL